MHDKDNELKDIKCLKEYCIKYLCDDKINDIHAAGEIVDMIKDLAEVEEKHAKKLYYEKMTELLEDDEMNMRMGYDNWRYPSGRFAPKGRGTYSPSGYMPIIYTKTHEGEPWGDERDPRHFMMDDRWTYDDFANKKYRDDNIRYGMTNSGDMHSLEHIKEAYRNAGPEEQAKMKTELSRIFNEPNKLV